MAVVSIRPLGSTSLSRPLPKQGGEVVSITRRWLVFALVIPTLGIINFINPEMPWLSYLAPSVPPNKWARLFGVFLGGAIASHVVIFYLLRGVRHLYGLAKPPDLTAENQWPPILTGFSESFLYPTAWLVGKPEFIGILLALKAAGQWKFWQEGYSGRNRYQMFLLGNALSIGCGFIMFRIVRAVISS